MSTRMTLLRVNVLIVMMAGFTVSRRKLRLPEWLGPRAPADGISLRERPLLTIGQRFRVCSVSDTGRLLKT